MDKHLLKVQNPSRYTGGEFNSEVAKLDVPLQFLLCFPDVYEIGFSNLGIKIIYSVLNNREDTSCELCFAPKDDFAKIMEEEKIELFSLTSKTEAKKFDFVGFSLASELLYSNVLYMLKLAKIEVERKKRTEKCPIIIAGGATTVNPNPMSDFIDIFVIGDGEEVVEKISDAYCASKCKGESREKFFLSISNIKGVYVPRVHGEFDRKAIGRAVYKNLDKAPFPTKQPLPNIEAVHNRGVLELFRGCANGCKFCQACHINTPVRFRSVDTLVKQAEELIVNNGYDELALGSLSTCDYPFLDELLKRLKPIVEKHKVKLSIPSTRLNSFVEGAVELSRKSSITFAPEAATQRLRDVIGKKITDDEIEKGLKAAFRVGYSGVKLYFMIGLPSETDEDVFEIINIAKKIKQWYRETATNRKPLNLTISAATFVPKPLTPFENEKQIPLERIKFLQAHLKDGLKKIGVRFSFHDAGTSIVEWALACGGTEMGKKILAAHKAGCKFDAWSEHFCFERWSKALGRRGEAGETFL